MLIIRLISDHFLTLFVLELKDSKKKEKFLEMDSLLSSMEFHRSVLNSPDIKSKKKRRNNIEDSAASYQYILNLPQVQESDPFELIQQHLRNLNNQK